MEARKLRLSTLVVCRFCLVNDENLQNLYDYDKANTHMKLNLKILSCISVEIFPSDHMPQFICNRCIHFMETYFNYKQICRQADESIMRYLEKGTTLKPISWPPSLKKVFNKKKAVKTLEDGTTVQLSYPDGFDSDEEGEHDFYNVKIGEDQAACIKIVSEDNSKKKKTRQIQNKTSSPQIGLNKEKLDCKLCHKTFIRASHYMRHMKVKHPNGEEASDSFSCDQCGDVFSTQDDLIYHSAIHATQNLTCPLCLEKFENVEAVTAHIKSHVNGVEFMCDLCELVFLSKAKLDAHLTNSHKEELSGAQDIEQDTNSMEMDAEEDEDDDAIQVKQIGDEMLVEIKKPANFMLSPREELEGANTNSEESEQEMVLPEAPPPDIAVITKIPPQVAQKPSEARPSLATVTQIQPAQITRNEVKIAQANSSIVKKAEEIKRKASQKPADPAPEKKPAPVVKQENNNGSSNDKSLRLLEKELQELKRTTTKSEDKSSVKPLDSLRNRRSQMLSSTPKTRAVEERKAPPPKAPVPLKKKLSIEGSKDKTKENKEPKEIKPIANEKDSKEGKDVKEVKETKEVEKDKETPKAVKNGANSTEKTEKAEKEEIIRRSSRPSKIKDYAKLVQDKPQSKTDADSDEDDDDEEYKEEKSPEPKKRRSSQKVTPKPVAAPTPGARKRGRPRKDEVPAKIKKEDPEEEKTASEEEKELESKASSRKATPDKEIPKDTTNKEKTANSTPEAVKPSAGDEKAPSGVLVSPTGQTLKQIPIRSLPPGVRALPLPITPRPVGSSDVCEMQIGKKMVKVQKIVMTKAEVEAMAKKGLVEMKDGAMVLKQGIKLPTADPNAIKSTLVGEVVHRESLNKPPTRCEPDT